jgi:hypothetical protein
MRTIIRGTVVAAATTVALGIGGTAFAAPPNGQFVTNPHQNSQSCFGALAAQIIQNGQFVSGNGDSGYDQTTYPGSRADAVHAAQDDCNG